jgi:hypothetical protein
MPMVPTEDTPEARVERARDAIMVFAMGGAKAPALAGLVTIIETAYANVEGLDWMETDAHVAFMLAVSEQDQAQERLDQRKEAVMIKREALLGKLPVLKL